MKLIPAYGRDYKSKAKVIADLQANKDFIIADYFHPSDGRCINLSQIKEEGIKQVQVRYDRLTKVAMIKI